MAIEKLGAIFYKAPVSNSRDIAFFQRFNKNQVIILDPALRFASAITYVLKIDQPKF